MIINGKIVNVMETWPLQITLATESGTFHVLLRPDVEVQRGTSKAEIGELQPGRAVRVEGSPTGEKGLTAATIILTSESEPPSDPPAPGTGQEGRGERLPANEKKVGTPAEEVPSVEMPPPFGKS